ncbi:hypothetical protein C7N43_03295 [Sphingobacteriales bacterium UPWRP_1]|nr:hypothetical protein BVG80_08695 [Sphingobacteriales bacterium TSM_CSM]PSJ78503.1 hypothetical protein C7N43_03295 [Sphingobacteriales bacterium UPWRP_1]
MRNISVSFLLLACCLQGLIAQTPTWSEHIAPILYTNCTKCHHNGGIAPFSLLTYADAYDHQYMIAIETAEKHMPPWPPDKQYVHYTDERVLCDDEIAIIQQWLEGGAPEGDPALAPAPPVYNNQSVLGTPDLSVTIPNYTVQLTTDEYRCFAIPSNLLQNRYITAIEVVPGNPEIVHHVLVFYDTSGDCAGLDAADPLPGYAGFGGVGSNSAVLIGLWAPGALPYYYPSGMGSNLPANSYIVLQVHYPAGSQGNQDNTTVNFKLSNAPGTRNASIAPVLNHTTSLTNGPLVIPANTVKTFYASFNVPFNATILSVAPHMHLVGTSIKSYAVTPTQDTIPLIDIPHWDFHWQGQYTFTKAIKIPAGSVLKAEAVYDNTIANPHNPNNPPQPVSAGEATTDEMMLVFFTYLSYQTGDENIVLDTNADNHSCGVKTQAKLYLEGPYNGIQMSGSLGSFPAVLPDAQPFNSQPWNYAGTEITGNTVNTSNIADWVLLELRRNTDLTAGDYTVARKAAFLYKDGTLHDPDGTDGVTFDVNTLNANYYLAVLPRGHLGVLSASPIALPNATPYNFTTNANAAYGNNQLKNIGGKFCLPAGDTDGNGIINYADVNAWIAAQATGVFALPDVNKDKNVNAADFNLLQPNLGNIGIIQVR